MTTMPDQVEDKRVVIETCDTGNGERLVWYSLDGLTRRALWDARPERSRQAVVREMPDEPPEMLCQGLLTWEDAYHYYAGCSTGFAIARGLKAE
jgi:hypothetical protein